MTATSWLRAASMIAIVQFAAHTAMFVSARPRHGADEIAVVRAMKDHSFLFVGSRRSYWDFYFGYGLMAAFVCVIQAVLFWQLAGYAAAAPGLVRAVSALFVVAVLGHAALALRFFFITPVIPDLLIAACLALSIAAG